MTQTGLKLDLVPSVNPSGIGNTELILDDDQQSVISTSSEDAEYSYTNEVARNESALVSVDPNANAFNFTQCTDVHVGTRTINNYNGQVTIIQNIEGVDAVDRALCNGQSVKTAPLGLIPNQVENSFKIFMKKHLRTIAIAISFIIIIIVATASTVALLRLQGSNGYTESTVSPTTTLPSSITTSRDIDKVQFIKRGHWGGRTPLNTTTLDSPASLVIIKHSGTESCGNVLICSEIVQKLQSLHVGKGAWDIWYNFMIGGDGNVYIGRGFGVENHGKWKNSVDICFLGNFNIGELTKKMIVAAKMILTNGVVKSAIALDFKLVNHNQTENTTSPGKNVMREVAKWPNYSNETLVNLTIV